MAGGGAAIVRAADGAPYEPLATIDELYPDRPDAAWPGGRPRGGTK
jgi:orotate phosphoribosyltransferase